MMRLYDLMHTGQQNNDMVSKARTQYSAAGATWCFQKKMLTYG
jgi:hypothetical protein